MNPYEPANHDPQPQDARTENDLMPPPKDDTVGCGVLYWPLGLLVSFLLLALVCGFLGEIGVAFMYLALVSVTQLLFVVPMSLYFRKAKKHHALKGLLGTAAAIFLLNGGCLAYVFSSM